MPWQSAPPLIIICGCFTATGILLNLTDKLATGRNRRVMIGQFETNMDLRSANVKELTKLTEKSIKEAEENAAKTLGKESKL